MKLIALHYPTQTNVTFKNLLFIQPVPTFLQKNGFDLEHLQTNLTF